MTTGEMRRAAEGTEKGGVTGVMTGNAGSVIGLGMTGRGVRKGGEEVEALFLFDNLRRSP
jgi:hypothetical protein